MSKRRLNVPRRETFVRCIEPISPCTVAPIGSTNQFFPADTVIESLVRSDSRSKNGPSGIVEPDGAARDLANPIPTDVA